MHWWFTTSCRHRGRLVGGRRGARRVLRATSRRARISSSPCCPTDRMSSRPCSAPAACWKAPRQGAIVVDMSSISPLVAQKVGAACADKGSSSSMRRSAAASPRPIDGTLAIMVGGKQEVFDKVQPILQKHGLQRDAHRRRSARATSPSSPTRSSWPATSPPWAKRWCWPPGRASTPKWSSTPSRADWPAAPCSTPKRPW